ncbi:MAG: NUDIX domain-containing protein [Anaerolineae bacterium]|nr:NUDIX domain-containing protein [Anaerolineae bacterium]
MNYCSTEEVAAPAPVHRYRAAGGVVLDEHDRVLLIERVVWREGRQVHEVRLPKGHVEPGETDEQAALREVCEETGYCGLRIIADLGEDITRFVRNGRPVHRCEHYYLMRLVDPQRGAPSFDSPAAEEALFRPLWAADLAEAEQQITFESERRFIRRAREIAPTATMS